MLNRIRRFLTMLTVMMVVVASPAIADMLPCDQYDPTCDNALPRTSFYDTPTPLPPGPRGELLKAEPADEYQSSVDAAATRILYRSAGLNRQAAVSGVVLVPRGQPPAGGWPVIAYAHGASGSANLCAPSLMADLYHGMQLTALVDEGFAVVATDYAGLGGPGRHSILSKRVLARNVFDSVAAAREAVPSLSSHWVAYGHSQGGLAVLGLGELMRWVRDPGYLGAVATAPPSQLKALLDRMAVNPYASGFIPLVAAGVKAQYPRTDLTRILTPGALKRLSLVDQSCLNVALWGYSDLTGDALVEPGYLREPRLSWALRAAEPGRRYITGPVLVLHGDADSVVPVEFSDALVEDLCRQDIRVEYEVYPGLEHDSYPGGPLGIDDGAMPEILRWIADRFSGAPASSACS